MADVVTPAESALAIQSTLEPVIGMPLLEGYPAAFKLVPAPEHYDTQGHLNNAATVRIFQDIRVLYMHDHVRPQRVLPAQRDFIMGVREMVTSFITEALPGEQLYGGCRILGRSARTWCFDEVLVTADRVVSRMRLVECAIRGGKAIAVPPELWAAVEECEGRPMPIREIPVGRTPWDVT